MRAQRPQGGGEGRRTRCRRAPRRPPRRGEEGFTLIELLIVIIILPLVMGAITLVLITTLQDQQGVQGKVTDAAAAATASSYVVRDIESAGEVTTTANPTTPSPAPCSAAGLSGTTKFLLSLELQGTSTVVSYYEWTPGPGNPELVRTFCPGTSTPQSHEILSDDLSTTNPPVPVVNCATLTTQQMQDVPTGVTCDPATDWTPTYMVSTITLNVTQGQQCPSAGSCAPYQYALTGDPVSGIPVPNTVQSSGVLTLRGIGTDVQLNGLSETVCAGGAIVLNSGDDPNNSTPAISSGSGDTVESGCLAASAPNPTISVHDCLVNGGADGTACPESGQHATVGSPNPTVTPVPKMLNEAVVDPLQTWASQNAVAPVTAPPAQVITSLSQCPSSHGAFTCPAGLYPNGLTIGNSETVTFQAGDYQFGSPAPACPNGCPLTIGNGDNVYFGTGHYTFLYGLSVTGSSTTLCAGVSACPQVPGGVFFYVKGGQVQIGGFTYGDTIDLAPITSTTDPYHGVLLWQDGGDNNPVEIYGLDTTITTNDGDLYTPNAQIDFFEVSLSQNATLETGDIVAAGLSLSGLGVTVVVNNEPLP